LAYVVLPEKSAFKSTVPSGIDVFDEQTAVALDTATAEHPVMLAYVEPFCEYSKFTVPVVIPAVRFAVMVTALVTTCVDAGLTTRPTDAVVVPVTR